MKKIAVVTSTRAEFGLLKPVIEQLNGYQDDSFKVELIVTGTHLKREFGYTIDEILNCGFHPDVQIKIPTESKNAIDISMNQAVTLEAFTSLFVEKLYDGIVILGDRYEMLAIAIAAGNTLTPIIHLCGGDTTEGAIDEWIRHSITKMSYLHFPTNEISRKRVIQLGESPDRVFNYGSTSIDNIINCANMTKTEALRSIGLDDCKYVLCTYHPVTMETNNAYYLMNELLEAIKSFPELVFIFTKSNADCGGEYINKILDKAEENINNLHVYSSLGVVRYLSLMRYSEVILGNSSSGIIEAPSFRVPTVNIGDRQRGRLQSESIINCLEDKESIINSIKKTMSDNHRQLCANVVSPYGDGHASEKIASKIYDVIFNGTVDLKKTFYDE